MNHMKSLVVYYSRTGNTRTIAQDIATQLKCDTEELTDKVKRKGFLGYIRSGKQAMRKEPIQLNPLHHQPKDYDVVIVGSPIWAFTMSAPIRTFLEQQKTVLPKVAFFCTSDSTPGDKTFKDMQELCGKQPINTLSITKKDIASNQYQTKINQFVSTLHP
jgi:menaquinone-dependent protoporphyrinogen IX oxidase